MKNPARMKQIAKKPANKKNPTRIRGYKGFNLDMTCRNFPYKEGKSYKTRKALLCDCGFHACEDPLDCFSYYPPATSVYHEVELSGKFDRGGELDSKTAATEIKIGRRIDIPEMMKISREVTLAKTKSASKTTGSFAVAKSESHASSTIAYLNSSIAACSGNHSVATAQAPYSIASAVGEHSFAQASRPFSVASSTNSLSGAEAEEPNSIAAITGTSSVAHAKSGYSIAASTVKGSPAIVSGSHSIAGVTEQGALAVAESPTSIAVATHGTAVANAPNTLAVAWGLIAAAKGVLGSYLLLSEWGLKPSNEKECIATRLVRVDGITIKPDTLYTLRSGRIHPLLGLPLQPYLNFKNKSSKPCYSSLP